MAKKIAKPSNRIAGSPSPPSSGDGGANDQAPSPDGDVALVLGRNAEGVHIIRRRSQESPLEAGLLRPMQEGKPIAGEVISLTPRSDAPMMFDVKSEYSPPKREGAADEPTGGDGPAQVASEAYRRGWDAVWGHRRGDRSLN